jgi:hypothetical protein
MDEQKMQNTIQFLVENQARFQTDLELLKESVGGLTASVGVLTESQKRTDAQINSLIEEMREGFNNLIVANEVTRDLASKIGQLTLQHSQRIAKLEEQNGKP